ncbi:nucleotidyltransferase family protein [Pelagicoccus sp. SDUM812003]|uniref:nucleotidyltransferase domain-containing protein n=1 Tax=Pelagicoccus sp. SDUM812003 TaxID=3041267 RepID=UPI00280E1AB0|nr:nucleotidyltransferase family protein [Pelagicoccus sp. SDUM812003]MDQ8205641.1 nucleotidyltransferase family protein [Pelagicoccus sp. SDUM812003]
MRRQRSSRIASVCPELRLLLASLESGPKGPLGNDDSLDQRIDWSRFSKLLARHRVLVAVCAQLQASDHWRVIDPAIRSELTQARNRITLTQMKAVAELLAVASRFEQEEIPYLSLKGPIVSQLIYGDPVKREFNDLDLLVRERDLARAVNLLGGFGFEILDKPLWDLILSGNARPPSLYHIHLRKGTVLIELHWKLSRNEALMPFTDDQLWASRRQVQISGRSVAIPGARELLAYLDIHGSSHCWNRLKWLWDSHQLSQATTEPYPCEASRIRSRLAGRFWRSESGDDTHPEPPRSVSSWRERFCIEQILAEEGYPGRATNMARRSLFVCSLYASLRQKTGYVLQLLLWPNAYEKVTLPPWLRGLYFILGPALWLRERVLLRR